MSKMKNVLKSNKGFTLVELMIVLSIIAILAVVLVPKVGLMKDSVREQGVNTNVNSVRAFLELQVNKRVTSVTAERDRLIPLLVSEFTGGNAVKNPFTNGATVGEWNTAAGNANYSVAVYAWNTPYVATTFEANANYLNAQTARKGQTLVWVCTDAYIIWGHDAKGRSTQYQLVK